MNASLPTRAFWPGAARVVLATAALLVLWRSAFDPVDVGCPPVLRADYVATRLWLAGDEESIYHDDDWINPDTAHPSWMAELEELHLPLSRYGFTGTPGLLWLASPAVALVGPIALARLQLVLQALALLVLVFESARLAGVRSTAPRYGCLFVAAVTHPVISAISHGHDTIFATALALVGLRWLGGSNARAALGVLALVIAATCLPWLVLLLPVVLVLHGARRCVWLAAGWTLWLVALPASLEPTLWHGYLARVVRNASSFLVAADDLSLRASLMRISHPEWPQYLETWGTVALPSSVHALERLAIVIALSAFGVRAWRTRADQRPAALAATSTAMLLFPLAPCWSHYLVLAIPLVLVAVFAHADRSAASHPAVRLLGLALLLVLLIEWYSPYGLPFGYAHTIVRFPLLFALLYATPLLAIASLSLLLVGARLARAPSVPEPVRAPSAEGSVP